MTNVAGAICIGQVVALYMTIGGDPTRRSKRCYSSSRLFRPVCASRRVASCRVEYFMHFTYFAYKTHADVKPATIRALDYIAGTDELDVSNNNVQWLSDGSAEIAFCPRTTGSGLVRRRNAFAFAVSLQLQLCRNSELTMILTVYRCTLRQYRN